MNLSRRQLLTSAAAGSLALAASGVSLAAGPTAQTPRDDELWFINSRGIGCGTLDERHLKALCVHRRTTTTAWQQTHFADFCAATGDGRTTVIFVHGNRVDTHWANIKGLAAYNGLARGDGERFRFVIWAWPADQVRGPVRDGRLKSQIANAECYKFGWALSQVEAEARIGLLGFSYGARVVTGASHLLSGGSLYGHTLPVAQRASLRTVLWAGALHNHWLIPGQHHGRAGQAWDRALITMNPCDRALRFYRFLDKCDHADALGYSGMNLARLGPAGTRVEQVNISGYVGNEHNSRTYAALEPIMGDARRHLLWDAV